MIEKIVKARKEHICSRCGGIIRKGNLHKVYSGRQPRFADDHETQIGIEFFTDRTCLSDACDGMLKYVNDPKKYLQKCGKGLHEYEKSYEFDHYVDCHRVYVPTGDYFCVNCGVAK